MSWLFSPFLQLHLRTFIRNIITDLIVFLISQILGEETHSFYSCLYSSIQQIIKWNYQTRTIGRSFSTRDLFCNEDKAINQSRKIRSYSSPNIRWELMIKKIFFHFLLKELFPFNAIHGKQSTIYQEYQWRISVDNWSRIWMHLIFPMVMDLIFFPVYRLNIWTWNRFDFFCKI